MPVFASLTDVHVFWVQTHQEHNGFSLLVEPVVFHIQKSVRDDVHCRTDRDVGGLDGGAGYVANQTGAGIPNGVANAFYAEVFSWIVGLVARIVQVTEQCNGGQWSDVQSTVADFAK